MRYSSFAIAAALALALCPSIARGEALVGGPYVIDPVDVNGGGTCSSSPGDVYTITASTAQTGGVGESAAGPYESSSGFWPCQAEPCPMVTGIELNSRPGRSASAIEPSGIGVRTITVTFGEPVTFGLADVLARKVTFDGNTEVPGEELTIASLTGSGTDTMVIEFENAWQNVVDTWVRLTLSAEGITDLTGNHMLDGDPCPDGMGCGYVYDAYLDLPTGDGDSGGDTVFYVGNLRADMWGDGFGDPEPNGQITALDINGFTTKYGEGDLDADLWGLGFWDPQPDGEITLWDINAFTSFYRSAIDEGTHLDPLPMALSQPTVGSVVGPPQSPD